LETENFGMFEVFSYRYLEDKGRPLAFVNLLWAEKMSKISESAVFSGPLTRQIVFKYSVCKPVFYACAQAIAVLNM
jgi:hypothetical protein